MSERGITLKGVLFATAILVVAAAILYGLGSRILGGTDESVDAHRMRQIYVALSLYQNEHDGQMAPNLLTVRRDLADDAMFRAVNDNRRGGGPFPMDPALPQWRETSSIPVSFSYLGTWLRAGAAGNRPWSKLQMDVRQGLISSWWYGDLTKSPAIGSVIRINMDGSVFRLPARRTPDRLTFDDLFLSR